nr:glycosyltransferase family 2 protein [Salinarchaeum sp. Harcht-Bsk1]
MNSVERDNLQAGEADATAAVEALPDDLDFDPENDASAAAHAGFRRRVVPIRHEENRGVGGAIKTGYQRARADRIDVTVVMGGDGQMDPDWMADLIEPVVDGRAEYAKANRLILDEHHETMPRHRFVGNHTLTILTKIATGYWSVGDPQHGYTAISLEALETAGVDDMYEFFGYCNDLLIRLSAENLRVADVPCPLTYADEESHITYSTYVPRVSGMLLRSFLRRLWVDRDGASGRGRLALFVGGAVATVGGLLGIILTGLTAIAGDPESAATPAEASSQPDSQRSTNAGVCRSALLAVAGVVSLLTAMLLDAVTNATSNYTERVPEDAEPRVENPTAEPPDAADVE